MKLYPLIAIAYLALVGCATNPTAVPDRVATMKFGPVTTPLGQAGTESTIRILEERERANVAAQDFAALEEIWSEHFIVNSPFNQIAPNRAVVLDLFRQGLAHYTSFERTIEEIRVFGDIAITMGRETVRPTGKAPGAGTTIERRFTNIWQQDGSRWRLLARHANNIAPAP